MKPSDFKRTFPSPEYSVQDFDPGGRRSQGREVYFFHVLRALWQTNCSEVQEACIRSLREERFPRNSCEALLSDVRHLDENHKLAQDTIVSFIVARDEKLASKVAKLYLEHSLDAAAKDGWYWEFREGKPEALASQVWMSKTIRFVLALLVLRRPKFLNYDDHNDLYLKSDLFKCFLGAIAGNKLPRRDAALVLNTYCGRLLESLGPRTVPPSVLFLGEEDWMPYERLFEYVVATKWMYFDHRGMAYVRKMAQLFQEAAKFEQHESFGPLLEVRAKTVCSAVLETEIPIQRLTQAELPL